MLLMKAEQGYDHSQRAEELFNQLYMVDHSIEDGGAKSLWWRGKEAFSTHWEDHSTSFTVSTFLWLIETGQIVIPEHARALDIGHGTGHDMVRFSKLGYEFIDGIDVSEVSTAISTQLADEYINPSNRSNIKHMTGNLFAYLPSGTKYDLVWSRGVGDYLEKENQQAYIELVQNETAPYGINVMSFVIDHPKSLVPGQTIVPCHNVVPLNPVDVTIVKQLYTQERGWKIVRAKIERDKEDIHHADATLDPRDRHSHSFLHFIAQRVGENPWEQTFGRTRTGLLVPQLIRGK